jgi:hypothetical protein
LHKTPETPKSLTSEEVDEHINSAFEIATYLRKNVVQGVRNDEGNYCECSLVVEPRGWWC